MLTATRMLILALACLIGGVVLLLSGADQAIAGSLIAAAIGVMGFSNQKAAVEAGQKVERKLDEAQEK